MNAGAKPRRRWAAATLGVFAVFGLAAVAVNRTTASGTDTPPSEQPSSDAPTPIPEPTVPLPGAMAGLHLEGLQDEALRAQLVAEADDELDRVPSPRQPFEAESVDDPFVDDALASYTLALAGRATGEERYYDASAGIVDAWITTVESTEGTCPDSGACQTSLVLSRAAPALIYASDLLETAGRRSDEDRARLHRWVRDLALPAASRRDNNWGDAGTYLRVVAAVELDDRAEFDAAIEQWRAGIDLIAADGHIPEETRRGKAGLMYSQEALAYKVAVAELAERQGLDLWEEPGDEGASLRDALVLTAQSLHDPTRWRWHDQPRLPSASPMWVLAAARWPDDQDFASLASSAAADNGAGHSGVVWTAATASP